MSGESFGRRCPYVHARENPSRRSSRAEHWGIEGAADQRGAGSYPLVMGDVCCPGAASGGNRRGGPGAARFAFHRAAAGTVAHPGAHTGFDSQRSCDLLRDSDPAGRSARPCSEVRSGSASSIAPGGPGPRALKFQAWGCHPILSVRRSASQYPWKRRRIVCKVPS